MIGKMASYQEELLLRQLIKQARIVRDTYRFTDTYVLDANDEVISEGNAAELKQLDRLLMAIDELDPN